MAGNTFLRKAISKADYQATPSLGFKLCRGIVQGVIPSIPNMEPPPVLRADDPDIAFRKNAFPSFENAKLE
jgi:hypothetical protein